MIQPEIPSELREVLDRRRLHSVPENSDEGMAQLFHHGKPSIFVTTWFAREFCLTRPEWSYKEIC